MARLSDESLNAVLGHALVAALVVDMRGVMTFANAAAERTFGHPASGMVGHSLEMLIPSSLRKAHRCGFARFARAPVPSVLGPRPTLRALHRDGHEFPIEIRLSPIETEAGPRVYCTLQDVSRQQRLQDERDLAFRELEGRAAALTEAKAEVEAASAMKSWFIGAAGHDLRQPLQASLAYLRLIDQTPEGAEQKKIVAKARDALGAMSSILDVLLDLGQLDSGTIRPHLADFNVAELVDRVIASCQPQAAVKDLRLAFKGEDCRVRSDPALLERIVMNFVANAVRYTEAGGVTVSCETHDGTVRLSVRDTGIGIAEASLSRIFDDYVQLGNTARERHHGLGLGLSIAKRVAQLLGHPISVRSTPGEGSTFTVELPEGHAAVEEHASAAHTVPPAPDARPPATVLLVDDDPSVRESLAMLLETFDMRVHVAESGGEALALVAGGVVPDMIVTDYRLPNYDGYEVIRRVRSTLGSSVPAVLMTGDTDLQFASHPDDFALIQKPFEIEDLVTLVDRMRRSPSTGPRLAIVPNA